jgi:hypothetical protein
MKPNFNLVKFSKFKNSGRDSSLVIIKEYGAKIRTRGIIRCNRVWSTIKPWGFWQFDEFGPDNTPTNTFLRKINENIF